MDANTLAIVIAIIAATVAVIATVAVALFISIQQGNKHETAISELRSEVRSVVSELRSELRSVVSELRSEVRALGDRFSAVESRQSRLEGANETLAEVLRRQSHTHEAAD